MANVSSSTTSGPHRGERHTTYYITDDAGDRITITHGKLVAAFQEGLSEDQLQSFIEDLCD